MSTPLRIVIGQCTSCDYSNQYTTAKLCQNPSLNPNLFSNPNPKPLPNPNPNLFSNPNPKPVPNPNPNLFPILNLNPFLILALTRSLNLFLILTPLPNPNSFSNPNPFPTPNYDLNPNLFPQS